MKQKYPLEADKKAWSDLCVTLERSETAKCKEPVGGTDRRCGKKLLLGRLIGFCEKHPFDAARRMPCCKKFGAECVC